jgi:hypothetical protein
MVPLLDLDSVRRAGNFHFFVSNMTPESAQNAAESQSPKRSVQLQYSRHSRHKGRPLPSATHPPSLRKPSPDTARRGLSHRAPRYHTCKLSHRAA